MGVARRPSLAANDQSIFQFSALVHPFDSAASVAVAVARVAVVCHAKFCYDGGINIIKGRFSAVDLSWALFFSVPRLLRGCFFFFIYFFFTAVELIILRRQQCCFCLTSCRPPPPPSLLPSLTPCLWPPLWLSTSGLPPYSHFMALIKYLQPARRV